MFYINGLPDRKLRHHSIQIIVTMKFVLCIALLTTLTFGQDVVQFAGTKTEGSICKQPSECVEPHYCLKLIGAADYTCEKKTCRGQDQCRIGQYCNDSTQKCDVKKCGANSDCPGDTICYTNGFCSAKGTTGQKCDREDQCWGECVGGACTKPPADSAGRGVAGVSGSSISGDGEASPEESPESESSGIGGGGIAGIVLGILAILALLAVLCWCLGKKDKKKEEDEEKEDSI